MKTIARPRVLLGVIAAAVLVVAAALVISGLRTIPVRTFALGVPDSQPPIAVVGPHHRACEGPVTSAGPFRSVGIFGMYKSGAPVIGVEVRSTAGRTLATGSPPALKRSYEQLIRLDHPVSGSRPVEICAIAQYGRFSLLGASTPALTDVKTRGTQKGEHFSLVLTRRSSVIGSLGTAFGRAALFRPNWVGAWTFWLLLGLLLATAGLAVGAVSAAAREDDDETEDATDHG